MYMIYRIYNPDLRVLNQIKVNLNVFTNIILACIVFSSITLAIEDPINENRNGFIDCLPGIPVGNINFDLETFRLSWKGRVSVEM